MEYIYLGKLVNTHGIKGEVRILSDFKYKDQVFKVGNTIYVGTRKDPLKITSYRVHKNYDMVTFEGITDINDVLIYKGDEVYFSKSTTKIDGILDTDLIGCLVYGKEYVGTVTEILPSKAHPILVVEHDDVTNMVPFIDEFIKDVDIDNKKITIKEIEGLIK